MMIRGWSRDAFTAGGRRGIGALAWPPGAAHHDLISRAHRRSDWFSPSCTCTSGRRPRIVRVKAFPEPAPAYVPGRAAAEEVALGTWLGVLRGLDGFDGRAPVKTWLFGILVSRARSARERERGSRACC